MKRAPRAERDVCGIVLVHEILMSLWRNELAYLARSRHAETNILVSALQNAKRMKCWLAGWLADSSQGATILGFYYSCAIRVQVR